MKEAKIEMVSNGFIVLLREGAVNRQYIFRSIDDLQMIRKLGEFLLERRIRVVEDTYKTLATKDITKDGINNA